MNTPESPREKEAPNNKTGSIKEKLLIWGLATTLISSWIANATEKKDLIIAQADTKSKIEEIKKEAPEITKAVLYMTPAKFNKFCPWIDYKNFENFKNDKRVQALYKILMETGDFELFWIYLELNKDFFNIMLEIKWDKSWLTLLDLIELWFYSLEF